MMRTAILFLALAAAIHAMQVVAVGPQRGPSPIASTGSTRGYSHAAPPGLGNVVSPTGTATPAAVDSSGIPVSAYRTIMRGPEKDPTRNVVCDFFVANWGMSAWPGTRQKPWEPPVKKRGLAGKWICDVSDNLGEVNGTGK